MAEHRAGVRLSGADEQLAADIERRIDEFEASHQQEVLRDGAGWVPRIRRVDYAIAIAVNALIVVWLILALTRG